MLFPRIFCFFALLTLLSVFASARQTKTFQQIVIQEKSHPAIRSAAEILAKKLEISETAIKTVAKTGSPNKGEILLVAENSIDFGAKNLKANSIKDDGYKIVFQNGGAIIYGARPRSLLYAAGDFHLWKDRTSGEFVREPDFAIRTAQYDDNRSIAEFVAEYGANALIGKPNDAVVTLKETLPEVYAELSDTDKTRLDKAKENRTKTNLALVKAAHDADVDFYAFLFGNDLNFWSPALYQAALKAFPSIKGTSAPNSHETAEVCPSDELTWKFVRAYVADFIEQTGADGIYSTFWDHYGIYCQDERCQKSGLDKFPNEVYENVKNYDAVLRPLNKKLVVRTWSSGVPHWLGTNWVHAPGYGNFGLSGEELWGRVFKELPKEIVIQTKVYNSDCQPDAPFSPLVGKAKPHPEIAEYQIAGQTVGRFYFPASSVDYNAATMKKAFELGDAGVNVFPGGTKQTNYSVSDDIANSINIYAWRELSWNVNADLNKVWLDWAVPIYGEKAAPHVIKALKLSEEAVNRTFSTLGMGTDTNSDFAPTIERRETLLRYTNRYFLPEYAKFLEPTKENTARVIAEKETNLKRINEMFVELESAKPFLKRDQYDELKTRFDWLKEYAICARFLDESLWRYRYLRALEEKQTTDPEQLKFLATAFDAVKEHQKLLFRYDPNQKFGGYDTTLGNLRTKPSLGNPVPLMKELYERSRQSIENLTGANYLPAEWRR